VIMRTLLTLALTVATATASAQSAPVPVVTDRAKDAAEVLGVVNRLWEAMRTNDSVMARSVFDSTAKLARILDQNGNRSVRWSGPDGFVRAVGSAKEPWIERMVAPEVRIDGNLASVWTWYDFSVGGKVSHCGYDSIELARMTTGWKIIYLADTRWSSGCDKPPTSG
jgi:hypothetical protein